MKRSLGFVLCLLILSGCAASTPARYYVLSPLTEGKVASQASCPSVGMGPIKLPEYVNRTPIVTRTSPNEITLSYFDLWAEPLSDSVPRTLAENVARLVCTREIVFFPWRPSHVPDYRVEVELLTMDGALGKTVALESWWSVTHGTARITRKATYTESVAGQNYEALVEAESRALGALSRDIAGALTQMK